VEPSKEEEYVINSISTLPHSPHCGILKTHFVSAELSPAHVLP